MYSSLKHILSPVIGEKFAFKETIYQIIGLDFEKTLCGLKYNVYYYEEIHSKKRFKISEKVLVGKFLDKTLKYI